jgi:nicotinate-nucleotide adenylyltransferase
LSASPDPAGSDHAAGGDSVRPRRIGLFGGSFDPVHLGHLALARSALFDLDLDELRFVPAGQPWQKPHRLAPACDRVEMLELALADPAAGDPRFSIEHCELRRSGPSYMIDTVEQLQQRDPGHRWFLLIGQDQHAGLHTWHRWRDLLARVEVAVAARPDGISQPVHPDVLAFGHRALQMQPDPVSSTRLRERVSQGLPIAGLVPSAVAGYIDSHGLYRSRAADFERPRS